MGATTCGVLGAHGIVDLGERMPGVASDVDLVAARRCRSTRQSYRCSVAQGDYAPDDVQVLSPAGRCVRYFCIGVNYPERNEEYKDGGERPKYPSLFMRTHTSFSPTRSRIVRPRESSSSIMRARS